MSTISMPFHIGYGRLRGGACLWRLILDQFYQWGAYINSPARRASGFGLSGLERRLQTRSKILWSLREGILGKH